jgi:hypothetical protein
VGVSLDGLKQITQKMLEEHLTDSQKQISWAGPSGLGLVAYTAGYSAGYLTEHVKRGQASIFRCSFHMVSRGGASSDEG